MNNIEEAKKWFKDLFQGCYTKTLDKYPDRIFWIYDKNLIRLKKLSKITKIEKYNLDMSVGEVIFDQDVKNRWFRIKYENYWSFLESNFNLNIQQVRELTSCVVNDILNCKKYITFLPLYNPYLSVNDILNCKKYKTSSARPVFLSIANDILNCKEYTIRKNIKIIQRIYNIQLVRKPYQLIKDKLKKFTNIK